MGWFDYCDHLITEAHTVSRAGAPPHLQLHAALFCLYLEDPGDLLGAGQGPGSADPPSTCYVRLCTRTQLFLSGKLSVVGKTRFKTCSLAPRWFRMPWQRLWLRSYLWKFCSPSSYTCKFYLVPSRCGYAPGEMPTPPSPFLCLRPGTSLARVMGSVGSIGRCSPSHTCDPEPCGLTKASHPQTLGPQVEQGMNREIPTEDAREPGRGSAPLHPVPPCSSSAVPCLAWLSALSP